MMLADFLDMLEKLLNGQAGLAVGLIIGGAISALGARYFLAPIIEHTKSANRLCRAVANLLIESELKQMQSKGRELLGELENRE